MKKLRCVASGNYNLQIDKEYEIIDETDAFVEVYNEKGILAKYSKKFFNETAPEDPMQFLCKHDLSMDWSYDGEDYYFNFSEEEVSCSCGVSSFHGINDAYSELHRYFKRNFPDDYKERTKKALSELVETLFDDLNKIMILSTNNSIPAVWEVLHEKADWASEQAPSDEEGGVIKVFIFYSK